MSARLELPVPVSANRYWRVFRNQTVVSAEAKRFKHEVLIASIQQRCPDPTGDAKVKVLIDYHPKARKKETGKPLRRLDCDNVIKVLIDALKGIAYLDDYQVIEVTAKVLDPVEFGKVIVNWEEV